jgi:hypothetical protein
VRHSRDLPKASSRRDALRSELLSAPRTDDQVWRLRDHLISRHNTVLGRALVPVIGEDVDAARDFDELQDPSNSEDRRIVPLLEEYPRPFWQAFRAFSGFGQTRFKRSDELPSLFVYIDDRAQRPNHIEDPDDVADWRHGPQPHGE